MSKYFHFHSVDGELDKALKGFQCQFIKPNRQRCKKRCVIGIPLCWIHSLQEYKVKVRESNIPNAGLGLFVDDKDSDDNEIVFKNGELICLYNGEIINQHKLNERYSRFTAPYAIELHKKVFEDGAIERGIGSLINHTTRAKANVRFSISRENKCNIVAIKNIRNNQELLINYGSSYKFNEEVQTSTNRSKYRT